MSAATSMIVSSALAAGTSSRCSGSTSRTVLPLSFSAARSAIDSLITPASDGIVLDVRGHDEPHHLGCGQYSVRPAGRVGDNDPRKAMLGQHAGGIQAHRSRCVTTGKSSAISSACISARYDGRSINVIARVLTTSYRAAAKFALPQGENRRARLPSRVGQLTADPTSRRTRREIYSHMPLPTNNNELSPGGLFTKIGQCPPHCDC